MIAWLRALFGMTPRAQEPVTPHDAVTVFHKVTLDWGLYPQKTPGVNRKPYRHALIDAYSTAWINGDGHALLFDYSNLSGRMLWHPTIKGGVCATHAHTNMWEGHDGHPIAEFLQPDEDCYNVEAVRYVIHGADAATCESLATNATLSYCFGQTTLIPLGPLRLFAHNSSLGMAEGVFTFSDRIVAIPSNQPFNMRVEVGREHWVGKKIPIVAITVQLLRDYRGPGPSPENPQPVLYADVPKEGS